MQPDSPETLELIRRARGGDAAAAERLWAQQREPLRRVIDLRLDPALARRVDASDIVNDVLLEAHQRLADYLRNPVMPFRLWLRHLARDHIIDAHRRHRLAQRRSLDREQPMRPARLADHSSLELAAQFLGREVTPATAALRRELKRQLEEAVAALEEDDREIIWMRHYEQLSNQEAAAVLGLSEAAASMRHLRALRRLRALMAPETGEPGG
jgi:RNA polymerase sigma-70 factor (ECF subfamily)